ncbi:MAG: hypothetical protein RL497_365 [Pseudomonadota bacterium]|jgi:AraC-like DNA-binding protein
MTALALLLIGFSLFSALILGVTHFRSERYQGQRLSQGAGLVLLCALSVLQLAHFGWLYFDMPWVASLAYRLALFCVAPAFFLFSQPLLNAAAAPFTGLRLLWHGLPLLACGWLPPLLAAPLAFVVGAGYLVWLGYRLLGLRAERARFRLEITLLGVVFMIAIGVSVLGVFQAQNSLPDKLFYSLYASAIGAAFFLVHTALSLRPTLAVEVSETVQAASYTRSTLTNLDCDALLLRLNALLADEHLYAQPSLSLPVLAGRLGVSGHQLSELLNNHLGKGFARFLREARVAAAKTQLIAEPAASVLSVGLSVGFSSQSTFYDAFRELEGMTPGQFRKLNLKHL